MGDQSRASPSPPRAHLARFPLPSVGGTPPRRARADAPALLTQPPPPCPLAAAHLLGSKVLLLKIYLGIPFRLFNTLPRVVKDPCTICSCELTIQLFSKLHVICAERDQEISTRGEGREGVREQARRGEGGEGEGRSQGTTSEGVCWKVAAPMQPPAHTPSL